MRARVRYEGSGLEEGRAWPAGPLPGPQNPKTPNFMSPNLFIY